MRRTKLERVCSRGHCGLNQLVRTGGMASIFCDGACSGNGTKSAFGGWAWAFWPGPAVGEPTHYDSGRLATDGGNRATNQRAELTALLEALRWAAAHPSISVTVYTDSMYSMNCTTKWGPSWKKKGWKRDSGEPLLNLDLIQPLVTLWASIKTPLQHVRGHQKGNSPEVHGNNWVDRAAVEGARGIQRVQTKDILLLDIPSSPTLSPSPPKPSNHIPSAFPLTSTKKVQQSDIRLWFT